MCFFFFLSTRTTVGEDSGYGSNSLLQNFSFLWSSTNSFCRYLPNTLCKALCLHDADAMVKKTNTLKVVWYTEIMCSVSVIEPSQRIKTHFLIEYVSYSLEKEQTLQHFLNLSVPKQYLGCLLNMHISTHLPTPQILMWGVLDGYQVSACLKSFRYKDNMLGTLPPPLLIAN